MARRFFQRKTESGFAALRTAITMSRASEDLDSLPERFAKVISQFEALDVDPKFREDIYQVLNGAVNVALSMVDQTFPVEQANTAISNQLGVLSRALFYLQSRPSSQGFSILLPERGQLVGHFSTREEAEEHLTRYQTLGVSRNCLVVPTKVLSLHAVQPIGQPSRGFPQLETDAPNLPEFLPLSVPLGLIPHPDNTLNLTPEQDLKLKPTEGPSPGPLGTSSDLLSRLDKIEETANDLTKDKP